MPHSIEHCINAIVEEGIDRIKRSNLCESPGRAGGLPHYELFRFQIDATSGAKPLISAVACPRAFEDALGGQGEATTCRIDMGMELLPDSNAGRMNPPQLPGQQNAGKQKN